MGICLARCLVDLLARCIGSAISDILEHGRGKQHGLLVDVANGILSRMGGKRVVVSSLLSSARCNVDLLLHAESAFASVGLGL